MTISTPIIESDLPPLDQIRQTEAEVIRKVAAAREAAEGIVANAHKQAADLRRQAREDGIREGQMRYKEIISQAEDEAEAIVAEAQNQANELRRRGPRFLEIGVSHAIHVVVGMAEEVVNR